MALLAACLLRLAVPSMQDPGMLVVLQEAVLTLAPRMMEEEVLAVQTVSEDMAGHRSPPLLTQAAGVAVMAAELTAVLIPQVSEVRAATEVAAQAVAQVVLPGAHQEVTQQLIQEAVVAEVITTVHRVNREVMAPMA